MHILDTKSYQACMSLIPGGKYIHYDPNALDQEARKQRAERCVLIAQSGAHLWPILSQGGLCGRTLLAYKARFGVEVPQDNEAWDFSALVRPPGPVSVTCYFPDAGGELTNQTLRVSPNALVIELSDLLGRRWLEPINTKRTSPVYSILTCGECHASVFFVGLRDKARRALPKATRRTTPITIKWDRSDLELKVDLSEHGGYLIELKMQLKELGFPPQLQRLFIKGALEPLVGDHLRLRDLNIQSGSVIHVSLRMLGC
jgi:hypothetical protein